ncbi:MAG: glycosyltransferase family 4 protein, partial [Anaerolineae bacterium]|nr:glycosyltransferase family 4 protein [Anaerolineae bacterium]
RLIAEEYARWGLRPPAGMAAITRKQVQEFEEADSITVCSEAVARSLREGGVPDHRIHLTPLGFDPTRFSPGEKPDQTFRVMFVGLICLRKGVQYLLEAFRRLNLPDAELVLVGWKGSDSQTFLPRYEGSYRYIPFVPQAELPNLYRSASVLVLPSIEEGFGMVVYEAAACGVPSIITENVGATIRDGLDGSVVPIRDVDALAARLLALYENEGLRYEMGCSAQAYVRQYTWDAYGDALIAHYRALTGG